MSDKTYSLKLTDTSIGTVGGVINGALTFDNMICVASGVWYVSLAGLYPDENRIVSINLNRLMNWTATCPDGRKANADMYFVPGGNSIVGAAGRIQWTDAAGKPLSAEMATLKR